MRRAIAWGLAGGAALLAIAAQLPGARFDPAAALVPLALAMALGALVAARGWRVRIVALAALVATALPVGRELWRAPPAAAGAQTMIVVTHNVSGRNRDPEATIAALAASDADVLLLQETDGALAPYLERLRARFPYSNACKDRCSLAIFSRWPMARVRWKFRDAAGAPFGPPLIQSRVRLPWGGAAVVATLHLSRHDDAAARDRTRAALAAAVRRVDSAGLVIGGDFNLSPWGAAMRALDTAMRPACRATRGVFSFPAYWQGQAVPWPLVPIDHLYAGPAWSVAAVRRLPKTGSDHYPIRVALVSRRAEVC